MSDKKISVIVPVYNEEGNLEEFYRQLIAALRKIPYRFDVLFVDDGSRDASWSIISRLGQKDRAVRGIALSRNFGQQAALSAGLEHVQADAVIMMDADLQHPPELIAEMIKKWEEGYDVVYTIREETKNISWIKKISSDFFYYLFGKLSGNHLPAGTADFRLISADVLRNLAGFRERTRFLRGLISWMGYRSAGIRYKAEARHSGRSQYSPFKMIKFAFSGISSFSTMPLYLAAVLGAVISFFSFVYALYAIYARVVNNQVVPGWASILVSVLFLGGIQLLAIGILGEYLAKVYEEVKGRPLYIVRDRINQE